MFLTLLGYIVAKVCASPRNWTWFTRLFSPHEKVWSGDETLYSPDTHYLFGGLKSSQVSIPGLMVRLLHYMGPLQVKKVDRDYCHHSNRKVDPI